MELIDLTMNIAILSIFGFLAIIEGCINYLELEFEEDFHINPNSIVKLTPQMGFLHRILSCESIFNGISALTIGTVITVLLSAKWRDTL